MKPDAASRGWSLAGKNILVSGSSGVIGREVAKQISNLGGRVIHQNRSLGSITKNDRDLELTWDPTCQDQEKLNKQFVEVSNKVGGLHGMVIASGSLTVAPVMSSNLDTALDTFKANFFLPLMLTKAFRQKSCALTSPRHIVALSSVSANRGQPGLSIYGSSKSALDGFIRGAAKELAREGIRINSVALGLIESEMAHKIGFSVGSSQSKLAETYPLGVGKPENAAAAILFLLMDESNWITGTSLNVDGGYSA